MANRRRPSIASTSPARTTSPALVPPVPFSTARPPLPNAARKFRPSNLHESPASPVYFDMPWRIALPLLLTLAHAALRAGTVQGMILENQSGLPLSRARVHLDRVNAGGTQRLTTLISGRGGQFSFGAMSDGWYLVTAERETYAPAAYGQRRPEGFGRAFLVTRDSAEFIELRLRKLGVITGTVRDENGVGVANVRVMAYPRRLPLRAAASGTTDDRGVYRVHSLPPGRYWIRSGSHTFPETQDQFLPTFAPESSITSSARLFEARLDAETPFADVRPLPGRLSSLTGTVGPCAESGAVTVTLSTEEGNRSVSTVCGGGFQFEGVAPGPSDLSALHGNVCLGAFEEQPRAGAVLALQPCANVTFQLRPSAEGTLLVRRRDVAVDGPAFEVPRTLALTLPPGIWELAGHFTGRAYVGSLRQGPARRRDASPDWFQFHVSPRFASSVLVQVETNAGSLAGVVNQRGEPVPAAPVFLWPASDGVRRSMNGPRMLRADRNGRFQFAGLPPGSYWLMSSYDFREVDDEIMAAPRAVNVTVGASAEATVNLPLYETP